MDAESLIAAADKAMIASVGRHLKTVETAILTGAIAQQTYEQIAHQSGYSVSYIKRDIGPKLWHTLSRAMGTKVSKTTLRAALKHYSSETLAQSAWVTPSNQSTPRSSTSNAIAIVDSGDMPAVTNLLGRETELSRLSTWISPPSHQSPAQLVSILGMGGVGKTCLAAAMVQAMMSDFQIVIWRSVKNAPVFKDLLRDLITIVSQHTAQSIDLLTLLHYLRASRCLIVLDNLETLLERDRPGFFLPQHQNYEALFQLIADTEHQSCLVLTSREKPAAIATLAGRQKGVQTLQLEGLSPSSALPFVQSLHGEEKLKLQLVQHYGGNPLALNILVTSIQDLFGGEIKPFLDCEVILFNGVRRLFDEQFNRLSEPEKQIMVWLAVDRDWVSIPQLANHLVPSLPTHRLLEYLETLRWRSLIERSEGKFSLQPLISEYVTDTLIHQITDDFIHYPTPPVWLGAIALLNPSLEDFIQQAQKRVIIAPIVQNLLDHYPALNHLEHQVREILTDSRKLAQAHPSVSSRSMAYLAGNLLNLLQHINPSLSHYDFSGLPIWRADFQSIFVRQSNFTECDFRGCCFKQTQKSIYSVAMSPDGTQVASGDMTGSIYLWSLETELNPPQLSLQHILSGHQSNVWSVTWHPTLPILASGSDDTTIKLWSLDIQQCIKTLSGHQATVTSLAWHPKGHQLASASFDGTIGIWEWEKDEPMARLTGHQNAILDIDWHPSGDWIVSGGNDHLIKLWSVRQQQCIRTYHEHHDAVWSVAWNPDGEQFASGSSDTTIKLWDQHHLVSSQTLEGHQNWVQSLAWHANHTILASGGSDRTIRLWDAQSGRCQAILWGHQSWIWDLNWHPVLPLLVSGSDSQTLKLWRANQAKCLQSIQGYSSCIWSLDWSSDGKTLITGSSDAQVRLWDPETGIEKRTLLGHQNWVHSVAWHPSKPLIASSSTDQMVRIWHAKTGRLEQYLTLEDDMLLAIAWHPAQDCLAISSGDQQIRLWSPMKGTCDCIPHEQGNWIWSLSWNQDGTRLASGSDNQTIWIWNVTLQQWSGILRGHENFVLCVKWNPCNHYLASCSSDQTIRIWNSVTFECVKVLEGHGAGWIWAIAWHPNGRWLASAGDDQTIRVWDLQSGQCIQVWEGHQDSIKCLAWSPDGSVLASGGADEIVLFWSLDALHPYPPAKIAPPYLGSVFDRTSGLTEAQQDSLVNLGGVISR